MLHCIGLVRLAVFSAFPPSHLHNAEYIENMKEGCSDVELRAPPVTAFSVVLQEYHQDQQTLLIL